MHFFVTDNEYRPLSDAHDSIADAAEYAVTAVCNREVSAAFVIGLESAIFARDIPSYITLRVSAGADLDDVR